MSIELLNGAFIASFEKGKKGKPGKWNYKAVSNHTNKPKAETDQREKPEFPLMHKIELNASLNFQRVLKQGINEVLEFFKTSNNE